MAEFTSSATLLSLVVGVLVALVVRWLFNLFTDPLFKVPGPWLARFTRLWELQSIRGEHFEIDNIALHDRYGPVVRLAPNRYSIATAAAARQIYGHGSGSKFRKDRWYRSFGHPDDSQADIFSIMDTQRHAANRRKVAPLFSMTALVAYEPFVDQCIATLLEKFAGFASSAQKVDLPAWLQYYAFDVIGEITIGRPFGMMETGSDIEGILATIHNSLRYNSRMGLFNELHAWLRWFHHVWGTRSEFERINAYVVRHLEARRHGADAAGPSARADFIQKLLDLQRAGKVDDMDIFNIINANIAAGSDTTALTLSAALYHLARNPPCARRLRAEIAAHDAAGSLSRPVTFAEGQRMPYLQAVIKETLRVHPGVGQTLARVVPPEGAEIEGFFFPGGTVIGSNAWVVHRDPAIFGTDAAAFRPERWLAAEEDVAALDRNLFAFGAGSRVCIGKNISLLGITKLIPELYRHFDFDIDEDTFKTENVFFVKPSYMCTIVPYEGDKK